MSTEEKVKASAKLNEHSLTKKDLDKMFIRSNFLLGSFNFERVQNMGVAFVMIPAIKRLYKPGKERNEALQRHLEWFNTHPWLSGAIFGISAALEEQRANGKEIDGSTIAAMKIGLMGPFAGIGDPLFWGTFRPVIAALCAGISANGSILGPILYFSVINIFRLSLKWSLLQYGYTKGNETIYEMAGNKIRQFSEGATIVGLFVMGALVSKWTTINVSVVVTEINGKTQTVQDVLNNIMPGVLPLCLLLLVSWLLKKNVNPLLLIIMIFIIGILGKWCGILS